MIKIYLATPYSSPDPLVRAFRFDNVNRVAAMLMQRGNLVFSLISHTHPIAKAGNLPKGWKFWAEYDRTFIEWADEVHVFMQRGWKTSVGVTAELKIARDLNKPIWYINSKMEITKCIK